MPNWGTGLSSNAITWLAFVVLAAIWAASLGAMTPVRLRGWRAVPTTLFGWVWLGFGMDIVLRFLVLSCDSFDFGNQTLRLALLPAGTVSYSLMLAGLDWVCFLVAYSFFRRTTLPNPLLPLSVAQPRSARKSFPLIFVLTSGCVYLSNSGRLPASLITLFALIGSLWVFPAGTLWYNTFSKRRWHIRPIHVLSIAPAVIGLYLNPYREGIGFAIVVIFVAALFAGFRPRLSRVVLAGLGLIVVSTFAIQSYRRFYWLGEDVDTVLSTASGWTLNSLEAPWIEPLRRFHGFDSLMLTVSQIPDVLPYSGENIFMTGITQAFVPRLINPNKGQDNEGTLFGQAVWAQGSAGSVASAASISPSATGTLYAAGGPLFVALGGLMWGGLVGLCESWKRVLSLSAQTGVVAFWALGFAAAVERGFMHNISTLLQQIIVLSGVLAVVAVGTRRSGRDRDALALRSAGTRIGWSVR